MYDNVCKFLVENFSQDFARWLLGESIGLTRLSPSELFVEPIRADALILLESEDIVLHLEFQTRPDAEIPFRMADYRLRVYRRYPEKQMRQIVIYLKPTTSELARQTVFAIPGTRHEFEAIRLWERSPEEFFEFPGLLPLAILGATEDKTRTLGSIAERIEALPEPERRADLAATTSILAGLVLEKAVIRQILREETMRESVIYQDILERGLQRGLQRGRQEGEVSLVLRLLQRRVGPIDEELAARVRSLSIERLEALGEALLDFTRQEELVNWLAGDRIP